MKDKRKDITEELSEIAPFLANLKKENSPIQPYEVPTDYFNQLSDNIFAKTILQSEQQPNMANTANKLEKVPKTIFSQYIEWLFRPGVAVVMTSVLILLVAGTYLMNNPKSEVESNLTATDIEQYVEDNIETFDEDQLAALVSMTEVEDFSIEIETIEADDLEEYIEDNFIEDLDIDELM